MVEENKRARCVFIAFVKDIPIAFAAVDPWFKYDKEGVELDIISVRKEFQKKGGW